MGLRSIRLGIAGSLVWVTSGGLVRLWSLEANKHNVNLFQVCIIHWSFGDLRVSILVFDLS